MVFTKGVTYAPGDTVSHTNIVDMVTSATVSGVGREHVDDENFTLFTRSSTRLAGPIDKEAMLQATSKGLFVYLSGDASWNAGLKIYQRIHWKGSSVAAIGQNVKPTGTKTGDLINVNLGNSSNAQSTIGVVAEPIQVNTPGLIQIYGCGFVLMKDAVARGRGIVSSSTNGQGTQDSSGDSKDVIFALALKNGSAGELTWSFLTV